jgi:DNA-binding transcriptional LysR family regulator
VQGTITRVAQAHGLTRPAVSMQLSLLEQEVGGTLFERGPRAARLTPAGEALVQRLPELFALVEDIRKIARADKGAVPTRIRLCGFGSSLVALAPAVMAALQASQPQLLLEVQERESIDGIRAVAGRQADMAIADANADASALRPMIDVHPLCQDPLFVALGRGHPLAGKRSIRLAQLATERWALNQASVAFHDLLQRECLKAGFRPDVRASCRNMLATIELVRTAALVAALPSFAVHAARRVRDIVTVPLVPALARDVVVVTRRGGARRKDVGSVLEALRQAARDGATVR